MATELPITLIDAGSGNVASVRRAFARLGITLRNVTRADELRAGEPIVLPGVGAFGGFMQALDERGFRQGVINAVNAGTPVLGICVGLQVLFEASDEFGTPTPGLGLIQGHIRRFPEQGEKIPQIGWNLIRPLQAGWPEGEVYFVNSFYGAPNDDACWLYEAQYAGTRFCAGLKKANLTAFQFHPEKSGPFGHELLSRWVQGVRA